LHKGNNLSIIKNLIKNSISLASAEIITKALAFIMTIYIARYLQEVGFGKYSFACAFTLLFSVIADMGLSTLTIRELARDKENAGKYFVNASLIKIVLSTLAFISIFLVINQLKYPSDTTLAVYVVGGYEIINSYNQFYRSIFRAFEKMEYETLVRVIEKVTLFLLILWITAHGYGLIEIVYAFLITSIGTFLLSLLIIFKRFIKPNYELDLNYIRNIAKDSFPFALTVIFVIIYFKIDTVMLSIMKGDEVVGWYNASYNIIDGLTPLIAGSVAGATLPLMSKYYTLKNKKEELKNMYIQSFQVVFILGLFISTITTIFADKIIELFYGSGYSNSAASLQILIWAFFIMCVSTISSSFLNATNKQRIVVIGTGIGALFNVILNLLLIPKYSFIGAAFATVITEFFGFIIYFYYTIEFLEIRLENLPTIFSSITSQNISRLIRFISR
jgi:O-antigen/teichoic acid export membrane protein